MNPTHVFLKPLLFIIVVFSLIFSIGCFRVGFFQKSSEVSCDEITCSDHGTCRINDSGSAICDCHEGYQRVSDIFCVSEADPCGDIDCSGHGQCVLDRENNPSCECESGFIVVDDLFCEPQSDLCSGIDCSGHGQCEIDRDGDPFCRCELGYINDSPLTCVEASNPCGVQDDGTCLPTPSCLDTSTECGDILVLLHCDGLDELGENDQYVHDFSGRTNHARCPTPPCPSWGEDFGMFGGGYGFDGNVGFEVSDSERLTIPQMMTLSVWFYPTSLEMGDRPVAAMTAVDGSSASLMVGQDGDSFCIIFRSGTNSSNNCHGSFTANRWYHLVLTLDGTALQQRLFVDGESVIQAFIASSFHRKEGLFTIGQAPSRGAVEGYVDELIVWNRVLTRAEIESLYD